MNLGQLWSGNDYAWFEYKGRGESYRPNGKRVKVIRAFKQQEVGNIRESGYAEVMLLEDDGTPLTYDGKHRTTTVRARDIAMRWEEYEQERDHRVAEAQKREQERQERYERDAAERRAITEAKENAKRALIQKMVSEFAIPEIAITISDYNVSINRVALEERLGLDA